MQEYVERCAICNESISPDDKAVEYVVDIEHHSDYKEPVHSKCLHWTE
mgnify:FL=1